MTFVSFDEFLKSEVSLRNRDLDAFLMSKFNKTYLFGKRRIATLHRLKNRRLTTSPSKIMTISNCDEIHKILRKCINFTNNLVVGRRFGGPFCFTNWINSSYAHPWLKICFTFHSWCQPSFAIGVALTGLGRPEPWHPLRTADRSLRGLPLSRRFRQVAPWASTVHLRGTQEKAK